MRIFFLDIITQDNEGLGILFFRGGGIDILEKNDEKTIKFRLVEKIFF